MKIDNLIEARYESGYITVEEWDDAGQTLYRMRKQDFARLRELSMAEEGNTPSDGQEIQDIFERSEKVLVNAVWDWNNWDLRVLKR